MHLNITTHAGRFAIDDDINAPSSSLTTTEGIPRLHTKSKEGVVSSGIKAIPSTTFRNSSLIPNISIIGSL
jgi:hypothetical protein